MKLDILAAFAAAALLAAIVPLGGASHQPNSACPGAESIHGYHGAGGPFVGVTVHALPSASTGAASQQTSFGTVEAYDGCATHHDGEMESGVGGGRFPAGTHGKGCAPRWEPHHGYGVGAQYWADESTGIGALAYRVLADGPPLVHEPSQRCLTDGLITSDPATDPLDCGSGATGFYAPPMWTPATLGENVWGSGACNPYDGFVWLITLAGANAAETVDVYTPIQGHAWG